MKIFCILVAGVGFEPHDLQVMSLTSYLCSTPQCYIRLFQIAKSAFYL